MKVLFVTDFFWPDIGGIEVFTAHLLLALRERGHKFMVLSSYGHSSSPDYMEFEKIPVYRFPFSQARVRNDLKKLLMISRKMSELKESFQPDLIHTNGPIWVTNSDTNHSQITNSPMLLTTHCAISNQEKRNSFWREAVTRVSWITTVCNFFLADLHRWLPEKKENSSVIPIGLPPPSISLLPISLVQPVLLCVGRIVPEKGFDMAVDVFTSIHHHFPNARLIIVGDGPARLQLEEKVANYGLSSHVIFKGQVENKEVIQLLNQSTLLLFPSRGDEGMPLTLIEAAYMARPVVATRQGGVPEVVIDGITGFLVEADNPKAFEEAILSLLRNFELANRMGRAAQARAHKDFTLEQCADSYDELYKKLVLNNNNDGSS